MLELLYDPNAWAALVTLTALEIVLGIDNIVFISVLVSRCSPQDAKRARQIGLALALVFRIILLFGLTWLMGLTYPVVHRPRPRFLLARHHPDRRRAVPDRQGDARDPRRGRGRRGARDDGAEVRAAFLMIVLQIVAIDLVFSINSIVTAIGMAQDIEIMIAAVVIAMIVMYVASGPVARLHRRSIRPPRCWRSPSW